MRPSLLSGAAAAVLALAGTAAPASAQPRDFIPDGTYLIAANLTYECIRLDGNNVHTAPCYLPGVSWTVQSAGNGTDEVYIKQGATCLSDEVDTATGSDLSALPCAGSADQRWRFVATAVLGFKIEAYTGKVAAVQPPLDYETSNFVRIQDEIGSAAEFWGLYPV
jgi:hypothetical protein